MKKNLRYSDINTSIVNVRKYLSNKVISSKMSPHTENLPNYSHTRIYYKLVITIHTVFSGYMLLSSKPR